MILFCVITKQCRYQCGWFWKLKQNHICITTVDYTDYTAWTVLWNHDSYLALVIPNMEYQWDVVTNHFCTAYCYGISKHACIHYNMIIYMMLKQGTSKFSQAASWDHEANNGRTCDVSGIIEPTWLCLLSHDIAIFVTAGKCINYTYVMCNVLHNQGNHCCILYDIIINFDELQIRYE